MSSGGGAAAAVAALTQEQKDAKRAEILAKLAETKLALASEAKEKAEAGTPKEITATSHFGIHHSITCDGCCASPIRGYRYKCRKCENHDLCEECFKLFVAGEVKHTNKQQELATDAKDHSFYCFVEPKLFRPMVPANATASGDGKRIKPNDICPFCESGKKFKKCCGAQ
jgi:hypothetical protein